MPKVYVTQDPEGKNILPATNYGEIKVLLPAGQVSFSLGQVCNQLTRDLSNFTDDDYLLLLGDPVAIGAATAVAARWNKGRVKVLKWDRQEQVYFPLQMDLYNTMDR